MKPKNTIEYRVPYADTDQMGVVYYANYFVYFERARNELLREAGEPYAQMEEDGLMLPVIESYCRHKRPARYDDLLHISAWVEEASGPRVTIKCEVRRGDELLALGHTVHACVDIATRRPLRTRPAFLERLVEE